MVYFKVLLSTLLTSLATCEPPAPGYNYNAPGSSYSSAGNSYLPPTSGSPGYNTQNSYLAPSGGSGYSGAGGHQGHGGQGHGHGHENEVPKSYEFGYSVKDAQSGNDYNRHETSDGNVVRGEYRVALPDGRTQIVTYHADWKTGFHADVKYEGEARYPEPTRNHQQGTSGYNYASPDFSGSLTGFQGNQQPASAYGPPGYHH